MDYRSLLCAHQERHADVSVATFAVPRRQACRFGIVTADQHGVVTSFLEKPTDPRSLAAAPGTLPASMGIYVFTFGVLRRVLQENARQSSTHDFGCDILPSLLGRYRLVAFPFTQGVAKEPAYWRDVGTVDAYWQAHMDLLGPQPQFCLDPPVWPLQMAPAHQPPTIVRTPLKLCAAGGWVTNSVIARGCVLMDSRIERSVLAPGVCIQAEAEVIESVLFDGVHVGQGARIRRAILEHGVVVPPGTDIGYQSRAEERHFTVSEGGITVVDHSPLHQVAVAQTH
jgi:glucose-1-phosphate adenylyltransferase